MSYFARIVAGPIWRTIERREPDSLAALVPRMKRRRLMAPVGSSDVGGSRPRRRRAPATGRPDSSDALDDPCRLDAGEVDGLPESDETDEALTCLPDGKKPMTFESTRRRSSGPSFAARLTGFAGFRHGRRERGLGVLARRGVGREADGRRRAGTAERSVRTTGGSA